MASRKQSDTYRQLASGNSDGADYATLKPLLSKYDGSGPRYTSYPTALEFHEEVGSSEYSRILAAARSQSGALGVYIHVPFCEERCTYCGCHVIPTRKKSVGKIYLSHLEREIEMVGSILARERPLRVIHLGGGTPTYLDSGQLARLTECVEEHFPVVEGVERSIELDPRVTGLDQLRALRESGYQRLSFGVQDFDPHVQELIGRHQTLEQTAELYHAARDEGIEAINFDLVYGLPGQTVETMRRTLDSTIELRPDRIAVYGYAHLPEVQKHQRKIPQNSVPDGDLRLRLFLQARDQLRSGGYVAVGMDHFALPDDELVSAMNEGHLGRCFMGYTPHVDLETLGIGCSSIGWIGGGYFQNEKKLANYYRSINGGELPICRGYLSSGDDDIRRWVIQRLLCMFRIDFAEFGSRFGTAFESYFSSELRAMQSFEQDGLVAVESDAFRILPAGRVFVRNIVQLFDAYLAKQSRPSRFSRTV